MNRLSASYLGQERQAVKQLHQTTKRPDLRAKNGDLSAKPPSAAPNGGLQSLSVLALAGLVHSGASVLLLDEPTNNLDPPPATRC
jgi:ABC-type multidrug transport system ATPase subunit